MATYEAAHHSGESYCWTLLLRLATPYDFDYEGCPFVLPDVDGLYCKAYLEAPVLLRLYFRFKQAARERLLRSFSYPGTVVETTPWTGSYWDRVDLQLKALRIWELGLDSKPSRNHRTCKKRT